MNTLRLALLFSGGLALTAGVLLACGSDDTIVTGNDAGFDGGAPDTGDDDAGQTPSDAGTDADARPLIDSGLSFESFTASLADAYCGSLSRCCFGSDTIKDGDPVDGGGAFDGGAFDRAQCVKFTRQVGFEASLNEAELANDAGTVVLDQALALDCVAKVKALKCSLGRAEFVQVRDACFQAIRGSKTADAGCKSTIECGPGNFCNTSAQRCEGLRSVNDKCGDYADAGFGEEACSWRASGDTSRFCESYNQAGELLPRASWACKAALANGSSCNNSAWCANGMCSLAEVSSAIEFICRDPVTYFPRDPTNCGSLVR